MNRIIPSNHSWFIRRTFRSFWIWSRIFTDKNLLNKFHLNSIDSTSIPYKSVFPLQFSITSSTRNVFIPLLKTRSVQFPVTSLDSPGHWKYPNLIRTRITSDTADFLKIINQVDLDFAFTISSPVFLSSMHVDMEFIFPSEENHYEETKRTSSC